MKCMGLIGRKERGIAAVLNGQMAWEEALTDCRDLTLKILPGAGSTQNPAGLLRSVRMKTMIGSLKEEADLLIIDTPPCGVLSDAALFGGIADGAVLVVHQGTTKDREVRRALEFFEDSQIPVCGYVLNGVQDARRATDTVAMALRVWKIWLRLRKVRLWEREGTPEQ